MRLLEAGYEVIGVTFRFYELNGSTEYLEDARNLAERLGIRHITYDAREIFAHQQKSDDNQCHRHAHEDEILFSERTCVGFLFFLYFFHIYFCGFFIV
jgi:PP-loop superfamily ATP-utilizing enzyme